MSTTTRILLGFLVCFGVALCCLLAPLLRRVAPQYLEAAEEPMVDMSRFLAAIIGQDAGAKGELDLAVIRAALADAKARRFDAQIYNLTKTTTNTNVYITDHRGHVLFDSDHGRAEGQDYITKRDVSFSLAGAYGARTSLTDPNDPRTATLYVAAPIYHDGRIIGVVSVSKPQRSMLVFIDETRRRILWLGAGFSLVVVLGAAMVTRVFSRPIHQLTEYARAVARGKRVAAPPKGAPEVIELGRAFEEMRDALEDRKYVQRYVQTLTHEMKSPIAAIRGAVELLQEEMPADRREKFLANVQAETLRLQKQIDRLLALSAIETRKGLERPQNVALAELAAAVVDQIRPAAEGRNIELALICRAQPVVSGESFLIETALDNLVQNAIEFSPDGGRIRVIVAARERFAELEVEDEGIGIPEYALPRIFARFYSLQHPSTGRKSSGLGLCFVRECAELHGGEAIVTNRTDGKGVRATLRLPIRN
jgi:two-component system, OmpR family, sensor histidine kinase CreC